MSRTSKAFYFIGCVLLPSLALASFGLAVSGLLRDHELGPGWMGAGATVAVGGASAALALLWHVHARSDLAERERRRWMLGIAFAGAVVMPIAYFRLISPLTSE